MKAAFSAEAIGLGGHYLGARDWVPVTRGDAGYDPGTARQLLKIVAPRQPWVAEITGLDARYGLARRFLPGRHDYRRANDRGTRGVRAWWVLESGHVYQARYRTSWDKWVTRWLTVTAGGDITDVTEEEARQHAAGLDEARRA